jgi:ATP-binding cassette subfamily B protein
MTPGEMLEFMQYIGLLVFPLRNLGMTVAFGQRAAAALLRVERGAATVPAVADPPKSRWRCRRRQSGRCRAIRHVGFGYDPKATGAARLRPQIPAGRRWRSWAPPAAASPPSPACSPASTTCRRKVASPSTASTCATSRLTDLRHAVAIVFEDTFLFHDTVAANIAFSRPDASPPTSKRRPGCRVHTTSFSNCPMATTRCWASAASRSAAGSASALHSPGPSSPTLACWCSTMPPARSTRRRSTRSARQWPR